MLNYMGYCVIIYRFFVPQISMKFRINIFLKFCQFSLLSLKMREFSHFNQILLNLFDVSSAFHNSI